MRNSIFMCDTQEYGRGRRLVGEVCNGFGGPFRDKDHQVSEVRNWANRKDGEDF